MNEINKQERLQQRQLYLDLKQRGALNSLDGVMYLKFGSEAIKERYNQLRADYAKN